MRTLSTVRHPATEHTGSYSGGWLDHVDMALLRDRLQQRIGAERAEAAIRAFEEMRDFNPVLTHRAEMR